MSGAKAPPEYNNTQMGVMLQRISIVFNAETDKKVCQPIWVAKKGKPNDILQCILFSADAECTKLRGRSTERDEYVRYCSSYAYADDI
ncbi:unnamed protein product [Amoebophrya sp. A25]|nr:unnamed protein product [Amoebophrya sp. A25]|eukprot:GSA25T00019270001.1